MKLHWLCLAALLLSACASPSPTPPAPVAPDPAAAAAQAAVDKATADTKTAHTFGLDKTSWDLVRVAHEDIAAAATSIDNGEYDAAKRLADGASASLRGEIKKTITALIAKHNATLDQLRKADADEDMVTGAEFHLATAKTFADDGEFLKAKEIIDDVSLTLTKATQAPARKP